MNTPRPSPDHRVRCFLLVALLVGCGSSSNPTDAGQDASSGGDTGTPDAATPDAATDAGADAGPLPLPACGTEGPDALMACVDRARYVADLEMIVGPRAPGTTHHEEVSERCATRLADLGFDVERHDYGTGVNIVGTRLGESAPDERVLISAHYDGTPGCEGADDNATGTAGALEAARVLATTTFDRTLVVACWDEEERGLVGSTAYADRADAASTRFVANFVFEMIGYRDTAPDSQSFPAGFELLFPRAVRAVEANDSRGDFIALVADQRGSAETTDALVRMAARVGLPAVPIVVSNALISEPALSDLRRSDHGSFWAHGEPGIMITDTANFRYDRYHCGAGPDTVDQLDHDFTVAVIQATVGAAAESLAVP